ncbi:MAG: ABC transporter permease [Chloroflexi bacterium]|nr:ABC transporter permease [Chloroflexota bacterium]
MLALLAANLKMMVRDRQALFWALAFPLMFVAVFGLFDIGGVGSADLAIIDEANTELSRAIREELSGIETLKIDDDYSDQEQARRALGDGDLDYVLVIPQALEALEPGTVPVGERPSEPIALSLYFDQADVRTYQLVLGVLRQVVDSLNLQLAGAQPLIAVAPQAVQVRQVDYFDVVLIGLVGMGIMTNSIIFIAVKISTYRSQKMLKRLLATPLSVRRYFASEVLAHLVLAMVQAAIILAVGVFVFGGNVYGNILWLFLIVALATVVFLNIGFVISAWVNTPAAASGLGNVIALPMMFFSGTFFPTTSLPGFLPEVVRFLPLTPMLDAMRQVSIDGEAIWQTWPDLALLAGWLAISSVAAVKLFRFR